MPLSRPRRLSGLAILAAGAILLAGCSSDDAEETTDAQSEESTTSDAGDWPRTFENADGTTTEIPEQPESIVSTTVSVTGTLLAIDAPVTASGADATGAFFDQWADEAETAGVENIFPAGELDLEAVIAQAPDLIVVSATGGDSLVDNVADLQSIAPTIVVDYGAQTWQDLAVQLGDALGLEDAADTTVADFDAYVADAAAAITVPDGTANVVSYNGPSDSNPIARAGSAHGDLMESLGFTLEDPDVSWNTLEQERTDFVFAGYENLTELTSETTFILSQDDDGAQAFADDATLANVPSVVSGQVYGLGLNSFRVDKYSATEIVDHVVELFGN